MSSLTDKAKRGEKLDCLVIDAHCHLGPWPNFPVHEGDAAGMVRVMDRIGIAVACVAAHAGIGPDFVLGNDLAHDASKRFPGRILPYICVNPNFDDGCLAEVERCMALGMRNLKVHSIHGKPYDCDAYRKAYEVANRLSWVVLAHTWGKDAQVFEGLAADYPRAKFLLAHSGVADFDLYVQLAKKRENIYLDLATSYVYYDLVEDFVRRAGAEKVLMGSDFPFICASQQIGKVLMARISEDDKLQILGLNAKRLFGL